MAASSSTTQTKKRLRATKTNKHTSSRSKSKPKSKPSATRSNTHASSSDEEDDGDHISVDDGDDEQSVDDEKEDIYDSDAIDEDDFVVGNKRKRSASGSSNSPKKSETKSFEKRKVRHKKTRAKDEDEDADALSESVYRQAENEWKAFVEAVTDKVTEVDPRVPPLPPKDIMLQVNPNNYVDVDHVLAYIVQPGGESIVTAGSWCPARNELINIRANLQRRARADRLRGVISAPEFVAYFGESLPSKDGSRQSIFGKEDELKVAPKAVDKKHRDLDLLKCRSLAVVHRFLDSEVLAEDFAEEIGQVVQIMRPFVHCLNDMMTVAGGEMEEEVGISDEDDS